MVNVFSSLSSRYRQSSIIIMSSNSPFVEHGQAEENIFSFKPQHSSSYPNRIHENASKSTPHAICPRFSKVLSKNDMRHTVEDGEAYANNECDAEVASFVSDSISSNASPGRLVSVHGTRQEFPQQLPPRPTSHGKVKRDLLCASIGCEVSALNSIKQHLFYACLEFNSNKESNGKDQYHSESQDSSTSKLLNFSRHINDEIETNTDHRPFLRHNKPQPLYLTGPNKFKNRIKSDYTLTRYSRSLKLEYKKDNLSSAEGDGDGETVPSKGTLSRPIFYDSPPIKDDRRIKIDILGVNKDDTIQVFITDKYFEEEYRKLMNLMKAYYDVTLNKARQKRENIPESKIEIGMIVVALVYPHTPSAKFVRARVLEFITPGVLKDRLKTAPVYLRVGDVDIFEDSPYPVPLESLFYIDQSFMEFPFLENKYQLKGLSFFKGTGVVHQMFTSIVNTNSKQLYAFFSESVQRPTGPSDRSGNFSSPECIDIFMGKGLSEQPVNYLFVQAVMEYLTPTVKPTLSKKAYIANCDSYANFWFQIDNVILRTLISFGSEIVNNNISLLEAESIQSISDSFLKNDVYVTRSSLDKQMHRAHVTEILYAKNKVVVNFIDWGSYETVDVSHGIYKAKNVDRMYAAVPAQALQLRIQGVEEIANCENVMYCLNNNPVFLKDVTKVESEVKNITVKAYVEESSIGHPVRIPLKTFLLTRCPDTLR